MDTEIPKRVRESLGWFATLVENKYYVDEAYNKIIVQPLRDLSGWFAGTFDERGIDGAVNGVAARDRLGGSPGAPAANRHGGAVRALDPGRRGGAVGVDGDTIRALPVTTVYLERALSESAF